MKIDEIIHPKDKSSRTSDVIGSKPKGSDKLSKEREKRNKDVLQGKDHDPNSDSDMLKTESLSIDHEVGSQNMSSEQADDFAKLLKAQKFEYFQDAMQYAIKHYEIKRYGGTGMFAMVGKGTNSDYIVRRSKDSEIRTIDNWWKFAKLAMENQNKSSCFPRILVTADLRDKKTGGIQSIGVVEFVNISKNKSTKRSLFDEGFFNWVIAALSHGARDEQDVLKFYARKKKVAPFQAWLEDKKKMGFDLNEFAKFIEVIGNAEYDIHTDNYGVANDGRFVIFDPVK